MFPDDDVVSCINLFALTGNVFTIFKQRSGENTELQLKLLRTASIKKMKVPLVNSQEPS